MKLLHFKKVDLDYIREVYETKDGLVHGLEEPSNRIWTSCRRIRLDRNGGDVKLLIVTKTTRRRLNMRTTLKKLSRR